MIIKNIKDFFQNFFQKSKRGLKPKKILKKFVIFIAVVWLIFEEFFWFAFNPIKLWLNNIRIIERIEEFLHSLNPFALLPIFLIPAAIMLFFKILALEMIAKWHIILGIISFFAIKIIWFFITSFIFNIVKNQILTIKIIYYLYNKFMIFSNFLHSELEEMWIFVLIRELKNRYKIIKNKLKIILRKYFNRL